jgi:hypothetical protein
MAERLDQRIRERLHATNGQEHTVDWSAAWGHLTHEIWATLEREEAIDRDVLESFTEQLTDMDAFRTASDMIPSWRSDSRDCTELSQDQQTVMEATCELRDAMATLRVGQPPSLGGRMQQSSGCCGT